MIEYSVFDTKLTYIGLTVITKFTSQMSNYTQRKFRLGRGSGALGGQTSDWGCGTHGPYAPPP